MTSHVLYVIHYRELISHSFDSFRTTQQEYVSYMSVRWRVVTLNAQARNLWDNLYTMAEFCTLLSLSLWLWTYTIHTRSEKSKFYKCCRHTLVEFCWKLLFFNVSQLEICIIHNPRDQNFMLCTEWFKSTFEQNYASNNYRCLWCEIPPFVKQNSLIP